MTDLSDKQLKIGYWWVNHRAQLKKGWVAALAVFCLFLTVYVLLQAAFLAWNWMRDSRLPEKMVEQAINFAAYKEQNKARDIIGSRVWAIPSDQVDGTYDLIAEIKNPNEKWASESLAYYFSLGGVATEKMNTFIMPDEKKYIVAYSIESDTGVTNPKVFVEDVIWQRVERPDDLPRPTFQMDDVQQEMVPVEAGSGQSYSYRVNAVANSTSVFSLHSAHFFVVLKSDENVVGLKEVVLRDFDALSQRRIEAFWREGLFYNVEVEIQPQINRLDEINFYIPEIPDASDADEE